MIRTREQRRHGIRLLNLRVDVWLILLVLVSSALALLCLRPNNLSLQVEEGPPVEAFITPDEERPVERALPPAGRPVRFLMYNVQNYFVAGETSRSRYVSRPKSEAARNAVAEVIAEAAPEIVGLIEIGGEKAMADLRERLAERGLEFPHAYVLTRQGEDRALGILSQHPIVRNDSVADMPLRGRQRRLMLRGVLDVTIGLEDGRQFRLIGAHLKSRMATDARAAEYLRIEEARTLAYYLHSLLRRNPSIPLLVFGDWNDGPADSSLSVIRSGLSDVSALTRLKPEDSRGHEWTLHYEAEQTYYAFDQMYVNAAMRTRRGRRSRCGIVDIDRAATASDHRALWCELR